MWFGTGRKFVRWRHSRAGRLARSLLLATATVATIGTCAGALVVPVAARGPYPCPLKGSAFGRPAETRPVRGWSAATDDDPDSDSDPEPEDRADCCARKYMIPCGAVRRDEPPR
jgi:hypothetical protein